MKAKLLWNHSNLNFGSVFLNGKTLKHTRVQLTVVLKTVLPAFWFSSMTDWGWGPSSGEFQHLIRWWRVLSCRWWLHSCEERNDPYRIFIFTLQNIKDFIHFEDIFKKLLLWIFHVALSGQLVKEKIIVSEHFLLLTFHLSFLSFFLEAFQVHFPVITCNFYQCQQ